MSWWNKLKEAGEYVYDQKSFWNKAKTVSLFSLNYGFNTIQALFNQASVLPTTLRTAITHEPTRMVLRHMARITWQDALPLVLVGYANDLLQQYGAEYLEEQDDAALLSTSTALATSLALIQAGVWIFKARTKMQLSVRMAMVTLETSSALNGVNNNSMTICQTESCSKLRFIKGNFRNMAGFLATEAAIQLASCIPYAGQPAVFVLSVYHHGHYAMSFALPDLCNHHQMEYLKEHSELALALGLSHYSASSLASLGIETLTHIPSSYYDLLIRQFMILTTVSMAAHMRLPPCVESSNRWPDPVSAYQSLIGFNFDVVMFGLKRKLPELFKTDKPSTVPWSEIARLAEKTWHHPVSRNIKFFLLPPLLRDHQALINDPVVSPNWEALRKISMHTIERIEKINNKYLVRVAKLDPKISSKTLWLIFGTPKSVIELLLKLMGDEAFMLQLSRLRRMLENLQGGNKPEIAVNTSAIQLRRESFKNLDFESDDEEEENNEIRLVKPSSRVHGLFAYNIAEESQGIEDETTLPAIIKARNKDSKDNTDFKFLRRNSRRTQSNLSLMPAPPSHS